MPRSMTGFGSASARTDDLGIVIEIRSVNHRHLDVRPHLPSELATFAKPIEDRVRKVLARGRVDVSLQLESVGSESRTRSVDIEAARTYLEACRAVAEALDLPLTVSAEHVVDASSALRGAPPPLDLEALEAAMASGVDEALGALVQMRSAEGRSLAEELAQHVERVRTLRASIAGDVGRVVQEKKRKLEERVGELLGDSTLDPARVAQEIALLADRMDVTEELERLASHCDQFSGLLSSDSSVGRKLDFLIQEMNREANTIGSKCSDAAIAHVVVELKAELERMREQAQNVE
jgi:uncharacterized protein (TIGR00255 family)